MFDRFHPGQFLLLAIAGWINRRQQAVRWFIDPLRLSVYLPALFSAQGPLASESGRVDAGATTRGSNTVFWGPGPG